MGNRQPQNQNTAGTTEVQNPPAPALDPAHANFIQSVFRNNEELGFIPLRGDGLGARPRIRAGIKKATPVELNFDINEKSIKFNDNPNYESIKSITFTLDTKVDINVTIYHFAEEIRENDALRNHVSKITPTTKNKNNSMRFTKGINIEIPIGQSQVDFIGISEQKYEFNQDKSYYPLIVKIERMDFDSFADLKKEATVIDNQNKDDNNPQASDLQQQINQNNVNNKNLKIIRMYAYFSYFKDSKGFMGIQFIKKGIELSDKFLWIKDVFGPGAGSFLKNKDEDNLCSICCGNKVNTLITPCRHMCQCYVCANILKNRSRKCPICRNIVQGFIKLERRQRPIGANGRNNGNNNSKSNKDKPTDQILDKQLIDNQKQEIAPIDQQDVHKQNVIFFQRKKIDC